MTELSESSNFKISTTEIVEHHSAQSVELNDSTK